MYTNDQCFLSFRIVCFPAKDKKDNTILTNCVPGATCMNCSRINLQTRITIQTLYQQGNSIRSIATKLQTTRKTVRRWINREYGDVKDETSMSTIKYYICNTNFFMGY